MKRTLMLDRCPSSVCELASSCECCELLDAPLDLPLFLALFCTVAGRNEFSVWTRSYMPLGSQHAGSADVVLRC